MSERILVIAHAHPDFTVGGGELAAYRLFQGYRQHPGVSGAWFLGRIDRRRSPTGHISVRRENEYLWEQAVQDWHSMQALHRESLFTGFADLLRALQPTVVHTHHYAHLGLEYLRVIKQIDPRTRIVMTLHEYMGICRHNGQMVKTGSHALCYAESPEDCHRCFPDTAPEAFWLRKHRFLDFFRLVDHFIAPSAFLRDRYIAWGLDPRRVSIVENGQIEAAPLPPRGLSEGGARNRFAFFGQVNPYKGIGVLLEALNGMATDDRDLLRVDIHGAYLEQQADDFQKRIAKLLKPLRKQGVVRWVGPYRPDEQAQRMADTDWVLVPSTWWENSPMVIQEAFMLARPVICSNAGGMAEKVTHGVDGLHARIGDPRHWAETLLMAVTTPGLWEQLASGISRPATAERIAAVHLELFGAQQLATHWGNLDCH